MSTPREVAQLLLQRYAAQHLASLDRQLNRLRTDTFAFDCRLNSGDTAWLRDMGVAIEDQ
jgi:hypothetical protein